MPPPSRHPRQQVPFPSMSFFVAQFTAVWADLNLFPASDHFRSQREMKSGPTGQFVFSNVRSSHVRHDRLVRGNGYVRFKGNLAAQIESLMV